MIPLAVAASLFLLFISLVQAAIRYVDLSHTFDEDTIEWPGEEKYKMHLLFNGTTNGYWYQKEKISTATHAGTHLDAPCHFAKGKWSVEQIPIDHLISSAAVVDVSRKTLNNPDYQVSVKDLQEWENQHGKLPHGVILLINTGWARFWPDKKKYLGTDTEDVSQLHFPGLSAEAAQWIATQRNIVGLGIDVPSIDDGQSIADLKSHLILADKNVYNLENVGKMDDLPATGIRLYVMPMKLKGASGAACRVIAAISDGPGCSSAKGVDSSFHIIIAVIVLHCIKDMFRSIK